MKLLIIAGPNGAGKTTIAEPLLRQIGIEEFVNVDQIARGLSMLHPERVAFNAGRIALNRVDQLFESKDEFAIETTLSSQNILRLIQKAKQNEYKTVLHFYALSSETIAIKRVQYRVDLGGHGISEKTIKRRFHRGLNLFFSRIQDMVDQWFFYQNTDIPKLLAYRKTETTILDDKYYDYQKKAIG